ncbi:MAG: hypothetical protein EU530_07225 [Promethearchaeota archaeon]|nr:MAG: hypothetical protein EU530_07225 [Candidatus Lokiarchaeota archaeon]
MTKRLVFIDMLRGIAIFYMIILHAFLYRVVHQYKPLFEDIMTTSSLLIRIIASPFIFLSLWGSIFCMITGIVFVYRVRLDFNTKESISIGPYFLKRGGTGVILILIQYFWLTFLSPKSTEHPGPSTFSLITGTIEQWGFSSFNVMHYSTTGMVESIGWIIVCLSILGYFVYRKKENHTKRFYLYFLILLLLAIAISVSFELLIPSPRHFFYELYENGKIFQIITLLKLTSNRFSFFPLIVFGLSGAIIGYNLYHEGREKRNLTVLFTIGVSCILGFIIIYILGFDMMGGYVSDYIPLPLHLLNFGTQLVILGIFYLLFKKYQSQEFNRDVGIVRFFQMYSSISLTIYIFESFTSVILFQLIQRIYYIKPISENFYVWMGFLLLNTLVWYVILYFWRKKDYKFSVEWTLGKLKEKMKIGTISSQ